jgi:hypothetical protein
MKNNHILGFFLVFASLLTAETPQYGHSQLQTKKSTLTKETEIEHNADSCAMELYRDCAVVEIKMPIPISSNQATPITQPFPMQMRDDSLHITFAQSPLGVKHALDFCVRENGEQKNILVSSHDQFEAAQTVNSYMTYTTDGLSWSPIYTANLSQDCKNLNLNCWFTVHNETNTLFENVNLTLFDKNSGFIQIDDVNPSFEKRAKNLFLIERPVTLRPMQQQRIMWLQESNIPLKKEYVLNLGGVFLTDMINSEVTPRIETQLSWINTFKNLPLGPITFYQDSGAKHKSPLMQSTLNKTELNMPVSFRMPAHLENGDEQPIQVSYEQTEFQKFTEKLTETVNKLTLTNTKANPITVTVYIDFPAKTGMIVRDSIAHQTDGQKKRYWVLNIKPGERVELKYRARITSN